MKFGDTFVGQAVYFIDYDYDTEEETILFGYILGIHSIDDDIIRLKINVDHNRDAIVNLTRLKPAKGIF